MLVCRERYDDFWEQVAKLDPFTGGATFTQVPHVFFSFSLPPQAKR